MLKLNLFAISGITIVVTFIPLIFFVAKSLRNNKKLLTYLLHLSSVFLWGIGSIFVGTINDCHQMDTLWKIIFPPVIFIPIFFYHAILNINNVTRPKIIAFTYALGIFFLLMDLIGTLLSPSILQFDSLCYSANPNFLYIVHYALWNLVIIVAHIELFLLYKRHINKKQNLFLLIVAPIGFIGGCTNFLLVYNITFYPIGNFFIALYSVLCTYAILRHEFLDIKIIIRRGLIYSILASLMTLLYIIIVVATESILQNIFGYHSVLVKVLTAFGLGLMLIPLKNRIQKFADHYFFKGSPQELSEQIQKYSIQAQESDKYKMAAKLAGNVAHEIKNPLTAIRTFVEQFPNKKNDQEFLDKFQKLASSELIRIQNLSMQLTDFAKPVELKLSTFDVHQVLDDVLALTNQRLQNKNIRLNKKFVSESLTLTGDKDQLKQVFLNLILNAVDAMENDGTLTVETCLEDVVRAQRAVPLQNNPIQIRITDTGCGISPENLKKLFEPFFTTKHDGTGLGLSICKRIIENHGGTIEVKSAAGKGTEFSITLPAGAVGKTVQIQEV